MSNQTNSINSYESIKHQSKYNKFIENSKKAVRDVLVKTGIVASTMGPMATTTTSTVLPASVNTITAVAPSAATIAEAISLGTAASLLTACGGKDDPDDPDGPIDVKDTVAPTINVSKSEVDITGGKEIRISGNQLYIGNDAVASRSDNKTKNCSVLLSINGKTITSGTTLSEEGTLTIKVSDEAGNVKSSDIKLNIVKNAPSITVNQYEVNIFGGVTVNINNNQLLFGDEVIASRNDDNLESCKISLSFNGKDIKSGDTLSEGGTLSITITNKNSLTSTAEITLTNEAIFGLENLKNASMQVDKEIDLLKGITFANGVELVKVEVEIDGKRYTISDPNHYTPDYPGTVNVIFTLKGKNGKTTEFRVDNLTIKPLEYNEVTIKNANMIQEKYPRYNNLQQSTKDFIYPHLVASYAACNQFKQDNRVHIIMGETADTDDIENIGESAYPTDHAYEGYYRIRALSPNASIKGCDNTRANLEKYIDQHPDNFFLVSCASDAGGGNSIDNLNSNQNTTPLRRIIEKENVIAICSDANRMPHCRKLWNENVKDGISYKSASINSKKNNKITVTGYNSRGKNNYFSPDYSVYGGLRSAMPVGFNKDKGNIVMPMIPLISSNNDEDPFSSSSYPTAVTSGVIGNAVSIIMTTHPGLTAEDAMTLIVNNYLKRERFQYKDETTDQELIDGDYRYFINMEKLLNNELLQSDKIDKVKLNSDLVELPSGNGICYTGKGIQFEYNGKFYSTIEANQSILTKALKSNDIKRYWKKDSFKKYGGTNSAKFNVYVVDKNGNKIPNIQLNITKSVI